jgi:allantoinase
MQDQEPHDLGPQGIWAIRSRRVVTPSGVRHAAVVIDGQTIVDVVAPDALPAGCPIDDVGDRALLPGIVDAHVHINEPGRTDWEGFTTATRSAAAGGITTLVDMPLNSSPVTTTVEALARKLEAAHRKLAIDCGFYGGVVPGLSAQVCPLIAAGVLGFKAFLCDSGIDEFPRATERELRAVMPELAKAGMPLLVHAELTGPRTMAAPETVSERRSYARHLASRPRAWELEAIRFMIKLCREFRCHVHIVHLSSADALPLIVRAREEALPLTVETCPHYLVFAAEEIADGDPRFKCAPPIREHENRERLWDGLRDGLIDTIGSDHSPAPPELKYLESGEVYRAWGGISSLQVSLPAMWTEASRRGFTVADVSRWMSLNPAKLVGLSGQKGTIAPGRDADLVVFDHEPTFAVDPRTLYHRHKATPYEGRVLKGCVETTYLRGRAVYRLGRFSQPNWGRALLAKTGPIRGFTA